MSSTFQDMKENLGDLVPEAELVIKAELVDEIRELKKEKDAVILGHNYMEAALYHTVTDLRGDSLELCRQAAHLDNPIIVFCGVVFMAETAKILNPGKKVLVPSEKAGCSLAEGITAKDVRELKQRFPGVPVVTYINTYADVKAETDICCTSGNAQRVVESLGGGTVIFLPDEYLARNLARTTGKHIIVPDKDGLFPREDLELDFQMVGWKARCEVHELFTTEDIRGVREQFPGVRVLSHPECPPDVVEASDFSGSTSQMIKYVQDHPGDKYLLLTECAMGDNIIVENRGIDVLRLCSHRCPHMNEITLEMTRDALKFEQFEVSVPEDIAQKALRSIERMLEI
jgi:quinolinate synthase